MTQRKLVDMEVVETSGVDHPAHLHEGWVVMKSADGAKVNELFGAPTEVKKEETVADNEKSELEKASARIAELEKELQAALDAQSAPKEPAATPEDVAKSAAVPEVVREFLAKQTAELEVLRKAAEADREALIKERETRLDAAAVAEAKDLYKALAFDAEKIAPALRKFALAAPEAAAAVTEVLKAADGQLESAGIFKEIGRTAGAPEGSASSLVQLEAFAKAAREADPKLTAEGAFAKAASEHADLYVSYMKGE